MIQQRCVVGRTSSSVTDVPGCSGADAQAVKWRTAGLLRQYLPKGVSVAHLTQHDCKCGGRDGAA
jgi:hypothetical protein